MRSRLTLLQPFESAAVILPVSQGAILLKQCSRPTPAAQGYWLPSPADVTVLEEKLLPYLIEQAPSLSDWHLHLQEHRRQYLGTTRDGRRFIYGNFLPASAPPEWRERALVVCDGGSAFFGVEFDVQAGRFTHLAFNGPPG